MAKLRSINTGIWDDEWFCELSEREQKLFIYFLTNRLTTMAGAYKITKKVIFQDTGFTDDELMPILERFRRDGKAEYRDGWIVLLNFLKNQSLNDNMRKGVLAELFDAPSWVAQKVVKTIKSSRTLSKAFKPFQTLISEIETLSTGVETLPKDELELEDEFKTPLTPKSQPTETREVLKPENQKPRSLPTSVTLEINSLLDAVAPIVGAKNRQTMANAVKWREVAEIVLKEEWSVVDFLAATKNEAQRNKASPQFFTPTNVLKVLQSKKVKTNNGFIH